MRNFTRHDTDFLFWAMRRRLRHKFTGHLCLCVCICVCMCRNEDNNKRTYVLVRTTLEWKVGYACCCGNAIANKNNGNVTKQKTYPWSLSQIGIQRVPELIFLFGIRTGTTIPGGGGDFVLTDRTDLWSRPRQGRDHITLIRTGRIRLL